VSDRHPFSLPQVNIGYLRLIRPDLRISIPGKRLSLIHWQTEQEKEDYMSVTGLRIDSTSGIHASALAFQVNALDMHLLGKNFGTGDGNVRGHLQEIAVRRDSGTWKWNGSVKDLQVANLSFDSIGRKNGRFRLDSARLNDLDIRWNSFSDIQRLRFPPR
jgi:hypothetical protein